MEKAYLATQNPGKVREFQRLLGPHFEVCSVDCFTDLSWDETGQTFHDNARIKAEAVRSYTECMVIADDSGLEVKSLGGAPGVFSARYGQDERSGMERVLYELKDQKDRQARFVCSLYVIEACGAKHAFEGALSGTILDEPRGLSGFGYDPIFKPEGLQTTLAEMSIEDKNSMSHRSRAVEVFLQAFKQNLPTQKV
ncbi:MAG: RdgB/HAM1 family non-canonical purine NTP pyrophosphatase [Oligoflexales bacterium]